MTKLNNLLQDFGLKDLQILSDFLGDRDFFLGTCPSEFDCAIFGWLAQVVFVCYDDSPFKLAIMERNSNLLAFVKRMKERLWEDWEDNLWAGKVKK